MKEDYRHDDHSDCCHPGGGDPPCGGCLCCLWQQRLYYIYEYLKWRAIRLKVKFAALELLSDGQAYDIPYEMWARYGANSDYTRVLVQRLIEAGEVELTEKHAYWPKYRMTTTDRA